MRSQGGVSLGFRVLPRPSTSLCLQRKCVVKRAHRCYTCRAQSQTAFIKDGQPAGDLLLNISFTVPYRCNFGEHLAVIGESEKLGDWDASSALPMNWTNDDVWMGELELKTKYGSKLQYKYIVRDCVNNILTWTPGSNFCFPWPGYDNSQKLPRRVTVLDAWDGSAQSYTVTEEVEVEYCTGDACTALEELMDSLDESITQSLKLVDSADDAAAPLLLANDRAIAETSQKAISLAKAARLADPSTRKRLT